MGNGEIGKLELWLAKRRVRKMGRTGQERKKRVETGMTVAIFVLVVGFVFGAAYNLANPTGDGGGWFFGYRPTFVVSNSMEPAIRTYAMCFLEEIDPWDIAEGDIIVYKATDESLIIHRVVDRRIDVNGELRLATKGDHNIREDLLAVRADQVKGRVIAIWNGMANLVSAVTHRTSVSSKEYTEADEIGWVRARMRFSMLAICIASASVGIEVHNVKERRATKKREERKENAIELPGFVMGRIELKKWTRGVLVRGWRDLVFWTALCTVLGLAGAEGIVGWSCYGTWELTAVAFVVTAAIVISGVAGYNLGETFGYHGDCVENLAVLTVKEANKAKIW